MRTRSIIVSVLALFLLIPEIVQADDFENVIRGLEDKVIFLEYQDGKREDNKGANELLGWAEKNGVWDSQKVRLQEAAIAKLRAELINKDAIIALLKTKLEEDRTGAAKVAEVLKAMNGNAAGQKCLNEATNKGTLPVPNVGKDIPQYPTGPMGPMGSAQD